MKRTTLGLLATLAISCGSRNGPVTQLLTVTSEATGDADGLTRLRFSAPVVDEKEVGQPLPTAPVTIDPPLEVAAHWEDRQTLVLRPTGEPRPSTRYRIKLAGALKARTGPAELAFVHKPLELEGMSGIDAERVAPRPELLLTFNQPVRAIDVATHCAIGTSAGQLTPVQPTAPETAAAITIRPVVALAQGADYELRCEGLVGDGGNVGMTEPFTAALHTYPKFALTSFAPTSFDVGADEVKIELRFSTPVDLETVRRALSAEPKIPALRRGWLDGSGTLYTAQADLDTETEYAVTLKGDVTDAFGQPLGDKKAIVQRFKTGDARPRLTLERGIFAVEASGAGYPVWTRNLSRYDLACGRIPAAKVVKLLTDDMNYDPWYDADGDKDIVWSKYGTRGRNLRRPIAEQKNKWHVEHLALHEVCGNGGDKRGVFLAEFHADQVKPDPNADWHWHPRQRVLANVTDLGLLLKVGSASGLLWVTSIADGTPVAGARATLYSPQGKKVFEGTSDAQGLLKIPGSTALLAQPGAGDKNEMEGEDFEGDYEYDGYRAQRLIVTVEKAGDLAIVDGNWQNGIQIWNFGVTEDRQSGTRRVRGFIQSDRGIYRPGETVHFKGIVREIEIGKTPRVPDKRRIAIHVEDSRGGGVLDEVVKVTPFGGFTFDLPLSSEASLGDYHVTATLDKQTFRERFQVEEFRKVEYELKVAGAEEPMRLGSKMDLGLEASYLFGAPVKDAQVSWQVQRRTHALFFPAFEPYAFGDWAAGPGYYWYYWAYEPAPLSFVTDGEGRTDDKGRFHFGWKDPEKTVGGPQDYLVNVTVKDATDQAVSKQVVVTAHRSDFYLGIHAQEFVQAVDMPFAINAVAVTPDGKQLAAKAKLSFIRERAICEYEGSYRLHASCTTAKDTVFEREVAIPATGAATERILPKEPGEYVVRLDGVDARGNAVAASTFVYVIGRGEAFWSGDESARMTLIANKGKYAPGEKARIVPRTSIGGGTALVTLERNGILDAFLVKTSSSGEGIDIPLGAEHAPNVFASVAIVRGRTGEGDKLRPRFQMGVVNLEVDSASQALKVEVSTAKPSYRPGEQVTGTIRVTAQGKPVRAEVALSAADEGVLQLIAYKTPNPMNTFYAPWGLGVDAATNWNRIARLNDPDEIDPDEGGDSGGEGPPSRSRFVSSAFWAPTLVTDEKGEIAFSFGAPDNLTAWRLMAVAADDGARFGSAESRVTVNKPLLVQPVLPRFLAAGDEAEVGVVVHNDGGAAGEATVTAKATGARLVRTAAKVKLDAGGSARVRFPVSVGWTPEATFEFGVAMGVEKDGVRIAIPVNRPLVWDRQVLAAGTIEAGGHAEVPVTWGSGLSHPDSRLEVTVDRTGLAEIGPGLEYLIQYPYGCLEQTLSGFIPLAKVQDLSGSLGLAELRGPKLALYLRAGTAKVIRHQHEDGHFSLWPASEPFPHLTAYAMYGLNEARRAGVTVDRVAIDRGLNALRAWANAKERSVAPGGEGGTMAMAAFVLADMGAPDTGLNARLYENRRGLPVYGLAFLLRAMVIAKGPEKQIQTLKDELIERIQVSGSIATVHEIGDDRFRWEFMSSDVRSAAISLSALLLVAPDHPVIDKLVEGLKKARRPSGAWYNTQDNLYALVALADYARLQARGKASIDVALGEARLGRKKVEGTAMFALEKPLAELAPGKLTIAADAKTRYVVRLVTARKDVAPEAVERGFSVTREYQDAATGTALTEAKAGQLVRVKVRLKTSAARAWVALVDPIPAGFEAVNQRLATADQAQPANPAGNTPWWWNRWSHIELRDDQARAFADRMDPAHELELVYLVRATIPGSFTAAPATAEAMYDPDVRGRTAPVQVKVKP